MRPTNHNPWNNDVYFSIQIKTLLYKLTTKNAWILENSVNTSWKHFTDHKDMSEIEYADFEDSGDLFQGYFQKEQKSRPF